MVYLNHHFCIFFVKGSVRVMTHMIFGTLALPANTPHTLTISPPSPYARRIPMHTHPSKCPVTPPKRQLGFTKHIQVEDDPIHASKYFKNLNVDIDERPREGMEYGIYLMLKDRRERLTPPAIAFMADTFKAFDEVIPGIHSKTRNKRYLQFPISLLLCSIFLIFLHTSWAPTMTMTLEFKFPIPTFPSPHHSSRTVAIFSSGKFINDPQGRHDTYVEVWTAPSDINEGHEKEGWKEHQRCLCVATQMALLLPIEVNLRQGRRSEAAKL